MHIGTGTGHRGPGQTVSRASSGFVPLPNSSGPLLELDLEVAQGEELSWL